MRAVCGSSSGYGDFGGDGLRLPLRRAILYAKRVLVVCDAGRRCEGANRPRQGAAPLSGSFPFEVTGNG